MINRKNLSGESAFFAVTAIAICSVLVAAAVAPAGPGGSDPRRFARAPRLSSRSATAPPYFRPSMSIRPRKSSRCGDYY